MHLASIALRRESYSSCCADMDCRCAATRAAVSSSRVAHCEPLVLSSIRRFVSWSSASLRRASVATNLRLTKNTHKGRLLQRAFVQTAPLMFSDSLPYGIDAEDQRYFPVKGYQRIIFTLWKPSHRLRGLFPQRGLQLVDLVTRPLLQLGGPAVATSPWVRGRNAETGP